MSDRELLKRIEELGTPRVLIIGDLILDRYITGEVSRISPEAPIPVLAARHDEMRLGGAGNVAANLRSMEAEVEIMGVIGEDVLGERLLELLENIGVESAGVKRISGRPTTEKTRMLGGGQQILRVDWEDSQPISDVLAEGFLVGVEARIQRAGAVILSDYGKGVLSTELLRTVIHMARRLQVPVLVDPKGTDYARYRGATLVTPNKKEAQEALGQKLDQLDQVPAAAQRLMELAELDAAVITLGPDGIYYCTKDQEQGRVPALARAVFDVTGAGDTVIAHLALGLAAGFSLGDSVRLANQAASLVVARRGAAAVTREELRGALGERSVREGAVLAPEELASQLAEWRSMGKRIVFTNGCFDILHAGHVDYLRKARARGDVLVVGVNDDASVRRLKGDSRPVNSIEDRLVVLAALEMVDAVVPFPEDTPKRIVEEITPDVLVKGQDWENKGVVGREWVEKHGGEVYLAPLLEGRSTTSILERAQQGGAGPGGATC